MTPSRHDPPDPTGEQGRPLFVTGFVLTLLSVLVILVVIGVLVL